MAITPIDAIRRKASSTFTHIQGLTAALNKRLPKNEPITVLVLPHTGPVHRLRISRYTTAGVLAVAVSFILVAAAGAVLHAGMKAQLAAKETLLLERTQTNARLLDASRERSAAFERLRQETESLREKVARLEALSSEVDVLLGKSQGSQRSALSSRGSLDRRLASRGVTPAAESPARLLERGSALPPRWTPLLNADQMGTPPYLADPTRPSEEGLDAAIDELESRAAVAEERLKRAKVDLSGYLTQLTHTPSGWPAYGNITSGYGYRTHPIIGEKSFHDGVDISVPYGSAVDVAADGIVRFAGWESGYGLSILVDHGYGYRTRYAHLSRVFVRSGSSVKKGQAIGRSGNSGLSTGPHLHYEVIVAGRPRDPVPYLRR